MKRSERAMAQAHTQLQVKDSKEMVVVSALVVSRAHREVVSYMEGGCLHR